MSVLVNCCETTISWAAEIERLELECADRYAGLARYVGTIQYQLRLSDLEYCKAELVDSKVQCLAKFLSDCKLQELI